MDGQVLKNTTFGNLIEQLIIENKPNTILEIGTWRGLGTTKRIIDGILSANYTNQPEFISIESNKNFYNIANKNLANYLNIVNLIYGRIIDIEAFQEHVKTLNLLDEHHNWLKGDIDDYLECDKILHKLPNKIEFLLLDGGEFSTYLEYQILKDRTNLIVLDDINILKNKKVYEELINDEKFELIFSSNERHGFAVFKKK